MGRSLGTSLGLSHLCVFLGRSWDYPIKKYLNGHPFSPFMFEWLWKKGDDAVAQSFAKVRQDTDALYQWVSFLYAQNQQLVEQTSVLKRLTEEQKLSLHELKVTVNHIPKTADEIRRLVDTHYSLEPVLSRVKHIEQKLELIEVRKERPFEQHSQSVSPAPSVQHVVQEAPEPVKKREPQEAIREKLIRKFARNGKEYVKNLINSMVHKYGKVGALQLREIIVEEQGLCSKSSFYRILEEMEAENLLHVVSKGKHTVYVPAASKEA